MARHRRAEMEIEWLRTLRFGQRMTGPRREILELIPQLGHSFDAIDVGTRAPHLSRATIFRTLRALADAGVLCHMPSGDGTMAYRIAVPFRHLHLNCDNCGAIEDIDARYVEPLLLRLAGLTGYLLTTQGLELHGRCPDCHDTEGAQRVTSGQQRSPR